MSLDILALNYLNSKDKRNYIEELKSLFKVRNKHKLYSVKGLPDNHIFKEYALNDIKILKDLHLKLKAESANYQLWESKLSSLAYQQWQRGFQGVPIDPKELNQRIITISYLRDKLLAKLPDLTVNKKSTSQAKG